VSDQDCIKKIERQISNNPVLLYLKGTPDFPMCGFSSQVVRILNDLNTRYAYVNILENPDIRATLPIYAKWPTFPQLYVKGELIGGCDIVCELHSNGELKPLLSAISALSEQSIAVLANE
jgi:monothiol glutaredoxin